MMIPGGTGKGPGPEMRPRPKRRYPEDELQRAVAQWLDVLGWLWNHTPAEGPRSKRYGGHLKLKGMKRGVPDVMIYEPWETAIRGGFGVAIELKAGRGKCTEAQDAWLDALEQRGWYTAVCRSVRDVELVLQYVRPLNGRLS